MLRTVLVSAIVENSALLSDGNGSTVLQNIEDIDFSETVSFTVPSKNTQNESTVTPVPSDAGADVSALLAIIGGVLCGVCVLALFLVTSC